MPEENLAGRTIAGYRLLERVGEGGTATVYRAQHDVHGPCAVKTLRANLRTDPTAVKRFLREAGYGTRVAHPSVVKTYDYGQEGDVYYLALEWVEGEPLSKAATSLGKLPPAIVAEVVRQLADGLAAAHAEGIIHRDLKPENMMYDHVTHRVKLLDFGIARDAQESSSERLTRTGFFVGTLQYVAPEALSGELVDEKADIYSLATITYYLLAGRHPYSGRSPRELFSQLLSEDPVPLNQATGKAEFPRALEQAVMKGLAKEPADRQGNVREFAEEIQRAVEEGKAEQPAGKLFSAIRSVFSKKSPRV